MNNVRGTSDNPLLSPTSSHHNYAPTYPYFTEHVSSHTYNDNTLGTWTRTLLLLMPTASDSHSSLNSSSSRPASSTSRSSSSYFTYPVSYAVSGLLRRLSQPPDNDRDRDRNRNRNRSSNPPSGTTSLSQSIQSIVSDESSNMDGVFTPPRQKLSPFQPPPLTPLSLKGWKNSTPASGRLLSKALAEEIRLLVPPRLQLVDDWNLIYSLEQNGVSLGTLYEKSDDYRGKRGGFVLVVQDASGGVSFTPQLPPFVSYQFPKNYQTDLTTSRSLDHISAMLPTHLPTSMGTASVSSGARIFFLHSLISVTSLRLRALIQRTHSA